MILSPKDGLNISHVCDAIFSILKDNLMQMCFHYKTADCI